MDAYGVLVPPPAVSAGTGVVLVPHLIKARDGEALPRLKGSPPLSVVQVQVQVEVQVQVQVEVQVQV